MMFTTEMRQLFAVALSRDRQRVTEALLREGVMQFISITELEDPDRLFQTGSDITLRELSDLRRRAEGLLYSIGIVPDAPQTRDLNQPVRINLIQESQALAKLDQQREAVRERQRGVHQEILKLEDIKRQIELYGLDFSSVSLPGQHSLLSILTGKIPLAKLKGFEEQIRPLPVLNLVLGEAEEQSHHLILFMKRDRATLDRILSQAGWNRFDLPGEILSRQGNVVGELATKLGALIQERERLQHQVDDCVKKQKDHLLEIWRQLRINELCARIQVNFQTSSRVIVFAGWLPADKQAILHERIIASCEGRCYLEWVKARSVEQIGDEIPVRLKNPKALSPFQMLVSNFGIPEYGAIDPTVFVMPIYLVMFGLMFADAGQGVILAVLGLWGARSFARDAAREGFKQLSWLLVWCGLSSVVFGILVGSYFGKQWFKPVWFNLHAIVSNHPVEGMIKGTMDILALTVYFGIAVILLGLAFNWINLIRMRRYHELVFDKGGLLGGWIYLGGIAVATQYVHSDYQVLPPGNLMFLLVGLPALGFLLKEPCHQWFHHERENKPTNLLLACLNGLMEWLVEMLELFTGYLSNTLSFMRIAALGIAHVCLMISIFMMASMTHGVWSVVILILGNALVLGLEGLSAGVQALRLNYYEFFTKFFHGTGRLHTPISLTSEL